MDCPTTAISASSSEPHKPRTVTHEVYESMSQVPAQQWHELWSACGADVFMDPRFLTAVERAELLGSRTWYVIVSDSSGQAAAADVISRISIDIAALAGTHVRRLVQRIRQAFPRFLRANVLVCGLPLSLGQSNLLLRPGVDPAPAVAALDDVLIELARREKVSFLGWKEFAPTEVPKLDQLLSRGYRRGYSLPMNTFAGAFADFTAYAQALRAHYRADIERSRRKARQEGITFVRVEDPERIEAVYTRELHRLYENVAEAAQFQNEIVPHAFFRELARRLAGQVALTLAFKDDCIVGFNWSIWSSLSGYHFLYCGLDYAWNAPADLYFNIMYAELDAALRSGLRRIEVGQTADTFKSRLGCSQEPRFLYGKAVRGLLPRLIALCFPVLFPAPLPAPHYTLFKVGSRRET